MPLDGVTVNQPLGVEDAEAVNTVAVPLDIVTVWAGAAVPPNVWENTSEVLGLVLNPPPPPPVPAVRTIEAVIVLVTPARPPPNPTKVIEPPKLVGFWKLVGSAVNVTWAGV